MLLREEVERELGIIFLCFFSSIEFVIGVLEFLVLVRDVIVYDFNFSSNEFIFVFNLLIVSM